MITTSSAARRPIYRIPVRPGRLYRWRAFSCLLGLVVPDWAGAQSTDIAAGVHDNRQTCLQQQVIKPEHRSLSVADLYALCDQQATLQSDQTDVAIADDGVGGRSAATATASADRFFRPYKDNYIVFGQARTADGSPPFSGEQLDTKFELGLTFNLFQEITNLTFLAPLAFGYSQRSWWDVSKDSQPFAEHNYNPEIFWQFDQPARPMIGRFPFVDVVGFEHQSNGLPGVNSRSWDRAYIQKEYDLLPGLSIDVKLWRVLGDEATNQDITDYLGQGQATVKFRPNERTQIRLKLMKGNSVEKYSYQLDIRYRRPWLNSAFFISYYEGYGEALISYNQKTRSLRVGLYFPLEVLSR